MANLGKYNHAGAECSKAEMMKAWDGPGEQGREARSEVREERGIAGHGGMKREAGGGSDKRELK